MKRYWQITLAALLVAVSTTDVASACGLTRGFFGSRCAYRYAATCGAYGGSTGAWSAGSTAGSVSRDLPSCSGGSCSVDARPSSAPACSGGSCSTGARPSSAPACSGGSCSVDARPSSTPACSGGSCSTGACAASSALEQEIALGLRLVDAANRSRLAKGLRPLELDERFVGGARAHSRLMASWRSCFHQSPPTPEICAAWQKTPESAVGAWELSGGHKAILHGARYTKIAPGVAYDAEGRLYWTLRIW